MARSRDGLTRLELAKALDTSGASVDRLVSAGLKPTGRRGKAHVYSLEAALALRQDQAQTPTAFGGSILDLLHAQTEEAVDRLHEMGRDHVPPGAWLPAWKAFRDSVKKTMSTWPPALERAYGAPGPAPVPLPRPAFVSAENFLRRESLRWPIDPGALRALAKAAGVIIVGTALDHAAARLGLLRRDGSWHLPDAGLLPNTRDMGSPAYRYVARPVLSSDSSAQRALRPLLTKLAAMGDLGDKLDSILDAPPQPKPPKKPANLADAKAALIQARTAVVRLRLKIKREKWRRREDLRWAIDDAVAKARSAWWSGWPGRIAMLSTETASGWRLTAAASLKDAFDALDPKRFRWPSAERRA